MADQPRVEVQPYSATTFIITLRGEHDPATLESVETAFRLASAYAYVLADLTECTYLDSSLIKTLLQAATEARQRGAVLELVVAERSDDPVRRIMEIAGVQGLLVMHTTRAKGIANLASRDQPAQRRTNVFGATVENIDETSFDSDRHVTQGACEGTGPQADDGGPGTDRP